MSFILDALKKSENERRRTDTPGIANIPQRSARNPSHRWIWIVLGLVAVNLAALAILLLNTGPDTIFGPNKGPDTIFDSNTAAGPEIANEPDQAAASFSDIVSQAKRSQPVDIADAPVGAPLPARPVTRPVAAGTVPVQGSSIVDSPESFYELRARGVLQLPDMHLDIHVYSGEPAERFVFVNMSKYKENATLDEGPRVREITPEGVILDYQGTIFLLPRE